MRPVLTPGFLAALLAWGGCSSEDAPPAPLDPTRVYEQKTHAVTYQDVPFLAEVPGLFRTTDVLPVLDVRALSFFDSRLHVGTSSGVFVFDRDAQRFDAHPSATVAGREVRDFAVLGGSRLVVAARQGVTVLGPPAEASMPAVAAEITAVAAGAEDVFVGTDRGPFRWALTGAAAPLLTTEIAVRDLAVAGTMLYFATPRGVWRYDLATSTTAPALRAPDQLADDDVRALALTADGATLLAATAEGLARIPVAGGAAVITKAGIGGLPNADLTAVVERDGLVLTGHAIGGNAIGAAKIEHYHTLRWIPAERVTSVAIAADGSRWFGTPAGVGRVRYEMTTLGAKAELNESRFDVRHWRMDGFVDDDTPLIDPWKPDEGFRHTDHDNDGLWTQMQVGAWCLAYGATKDERFYQKARRALNVMQMQIDIPALTFQAAGMKPGFITRSLVRDDEGDLFTSKSTQANWHLQTFEGRDYYWKDDTSSDEYAGHFFGYPLFYDLCAKDEAEKEAIRSRIRMVTDYLIAGGYKLIDLDGKGTTHGHWDTEGVAADGPDACTANGYGLDECFSSYGGGGWLNGMEILGHLLATWHMTGDQKYYDEYERLYTEQRYGEMIPIKDHYFTITEPAIANHSDHELAMLAYFTLARYEPNADRREVLKKSIKDFYEYERKEHNPWQIGVIASMVEEDVDLAGAIQSLKDMTTDWRTWRYDNSHRVDAKRWPNGRHGDPQFNVVFPYDEIRTMKWNGNPYDVAGGGSGQSVLAPTPYQIAYWKLRYFGLLTE